jgi:hypothetical protein
MNRTVRLAKRPALFALAMAGLAATASGYYHYLHFTSIGSVVQGVPEKFDLSKLYNNTVFFYVSKDGPARIAPGDSFDALLSQIRLAADTWNSVPTSALRVAYGGLFTPGIEQSTPHGEVLFEELPPGILAQGGPITIAGITAGPNPFVPITRSVVQLSKDLSSGTSYRKWSLVIQHEMGHALGLQHSMTSSAMTTQPTRATTRAKPLGDDDVAGLSTLYPNALYTKQFGSISGRVTIEGSGVHMASVVALTPTGGAIGTLTNPDGTYRIEGLPERQYYVYVQPLPPAVQSDLGPADIVLPVDGEGHAIPAGPAFKTRFYPNAVNLADATAVQVKPGSDATDVNFDVQPSPGPSIYEVSTWSYPGELPVQPAYVNVNDIANWYLVAGGYGLLADGAAVPGLTVSVLGGTSVVEKAFAADWAPGFLEVDFLFNPVSGVGARHLLFSTPDDLYVLPSGLQLVTDPPPSIASATAGSDGDGNPTVTIAGSNLGANTRILFDGIPAIASSYDPDQRQIVAVPPVAPSSHAATITALNPDGQVSLFVDEEPAQYTYPERPAASFTVTPAALRAGVESVIDIDGVNTMFAQGQTSLGFGTSDIVVKRVWVLGPNKLRASVAVAASAKELTTLATVTTGLETLVGPAVVAVQAPGYPAASISSDLVNTNGRPAIYPGARAIVPISNVAVKDPITATLNDIPVSAGTDESGERALIEIPANFTPGMATLRMQVAGVSLPPVLVSIDAAPPMVMGVMSDMTPLAPDAAVAPGDTLTIKVAWVPEAAAITDAGRFRLFLGGIEHQPIGSPIAVEGYPNTFLVSFIVSPLVPSGQQSPLTVTIDGRTSDPWQISMK